MAVSHVQHTSTQGSNSASAALAFGSNVTAGDLLIVTVTSGTTRTVSSVTDTQSNTWANAAVGGGTGVREVWWTIAGASAACTVTVNISGGNAVLDLGVYQANSTTGWEASIVDATGTNTTSGVQAHPCANPGVNTAQADEYAVTISFVGTAFVGAAATDWTEGSESARGYHQYRVLSGTLSGETASWSSAPASETTGSILVTFKAAAAGGGRTTKNTRAMHLGMDVGMGWRMG